MYIYLWLPVPVHVSRHHQSAAAPPFASAPAAAAHIFIGTLAGAAAAIAAHCRLSHRCGLTCCDRSGCSWRKSSCDGLQHRRFPLYSPFEWCGSAQRFRHRRSFGAHASDLHRIAGCFHRSASAQFDSISAGDFRSLHNARSVRYGGTCCANGWLSALAQTADGGRLWWCRDETDCGDHSGNI